MWVYIGTSELKNAYIGEVYEYSYDFRNKSSTILTNDGWTVTWSPTFNSNGMSWNWPSVSRSLPTRNTANKITLTHTFDVRSSGSSMLRMGTMSNGSLTNVSGSYTRQGNYRRIHIGGTGTNYTGVPEGTYTLVMTLDLVNDTWEVTTTWLGTLTWTITSSQKATILANMNNILADTYSSNGGYLQSLSVKIE